MPDRADDDMVQGFHPPRTRCRTSLRRPARALLSGASAILASALLGLAMPALAADTANDDAAQDDSPQGYQADRALCISGLSHQQRADCLREAGAAQDAARRGQLSDDDAQYRRNALRRCDPLPEPAREDCIARMRGEGTMVDGSVEEGGIYRERREFVPPPETMHPLTPAPDPMRPPPAGGAAD